MIIHQNALHYYGALLGSNSRREITAIIEVLQYTLQTANALLILLRYAGAPRPTANLFITRKDWYKKPVSESIFTGSRVTRATREMKWRTAWPIKEGVHREDREIIP